MRGLAETTPRWMKKETSEGGNPCTFRGDAMHLSLHVTQVTAENLDKASQLHKVKKLAFCAVMDVVKLLFILMAIFCAQKPFATCFFLCAVKTEPLARLCCDRKSGT